MKTVFLRALDAADKAEALLSTIREPETARGRHHFEVDVSSFANIPRSPFAYWVSERLRRSFKDLPSFENKTRTARVGLQTSDDFRFVRTWWEIANASIGERWFSFAKGGAFSPYYADVHLLLNWVPGERELWATENPTIHKPYSNIWMLKETSSRFFFRPGLTWPRRTNGLSLRAMPMGCTFADKGPAVFTSTDAVENLLVLAAVTNSRIFGVLVALQLARTELAQSYEIGLIQSTPIPSFSTENINTLSPLSRRAWSFKRSLDTWVETSHAFSLPALLQVEGGTLVGRVASWTKRIQYAEADLAAIQAEIDERCFDLYGIVEADRRAITEGFGVTAITATEDTEAEADDDAETEAALEAVADATTLTAELLAWAVGVAFGRFDLRLATSERAVPAEPEPFDPLPVCSPGMLTGEDGLPLNAPPTGYAIDFPTDGILVDDAGHPRDLTTAVRAVFEAVFGASADARWNEAAAMLDPKERSLRAWLAHTFFDQHLKRHSKSRRKAPIVWQIATPTADYSVWLYAHRLTKDSFFQIQNDLVGPKLALEERKLLGLVQAAGPKPGASQRKELAAQEAFVEVLRGMFDEIKRVAPLWAPDLNDGIVLTMAPLWRLVPQHKGWQNELKAAWEALSAGRYDWVHLAMHLWP